MPKARPHGSPLNPEPELASASLPARPEVASAAIQIASHAALFEHEDELRCDACDAPIDAFESGDEAFGAPGSGLYVWARGEEIRRESVPLCGQCASVIGMTALARWEIEEEEG